MWIRARCADLHDLAVELIELMVYNGSGFRGLALGAQLPISCASCPFWPSVLITYLVIITARITQSCIGVHVVMGLITL